MIMEILIRIFCVKLGVHAWKRWPADPHEFDHGYFACSRCGATSVIE